MSTGIAALTLIIKVFLAAMAACVVWGLLHGRIKTDGLLRESEAEEVSPDRIALLLATFGAAIGYISLSVSQLSSKFSLALPEVPTEMLSIVFAGNLAFACTKLTKKLSRFLRR